MLSKKSHVWYKTASEKPAAQPAAKEAPEDAPVEAPVFEDDEDGDFLPFG